MEPGNVPHRLSLEEFEEMMSKFELAEDWMREQLVLRRGASTTASQPVGIEVAGAVCHDSDDRKLRGMGPLDVLFGGTGGQRLPVLHLIGRFRQSRYCRCEAMFLRQGQFESICPLRQQSSNHGLDARRRGVGRWPPLGDDVLPH